jgi:hypothetical protein
MTYFVECEDENLLRDILTFKLSLNYMKLNKKERNEYVNFYITYT